jgi:hypothetical protein
MLLARGVPGDRERAEVVRAEAIEGYRALGMETWVARVSAAAQPSRRS